MIIYKVTNKINGMVYVGKTKRSLQTRWKQHCIDSKRTLFKYRLQEAIEQFGKENFTVEQIDVADSDD